MGGGDLNTKKSWHPSTFKNQERVWKAEQADAAEKRKLAELQQEINDERNREELKTIAKKSGLIPDDGSGDRKLEWMYKGPQVNREEYLLGRSIDKSFEQLDAQEKAGPSVGISQPKNHVEHECIPFSIRQYKGLEGTEQVDIARKLMEDPLMAIKQKEIESRQKILENPVKLKELHRLLKSDHTINDKKSKRKEKKRKQTKRKRASSSSSSGSSSDNEKDLDKILAEKYKKVQSAISSEQNDSGLDKILSLKYEKLSKELNKLAKPKKGKKKKKKSYRSDSSTSDSEREMYRKKSKNSKIHKSHEQNRQRYKPRSPKHTKSLRRSHSYEKVQELSSRGNHSSFVDRGSRQQASSDSESSSDMRYKYDSDDERKSKISKNFGLVSASGKKLEISKRDEVKLYKREEIKAQQSSHKPLWNRSEQRKVLTEAEIEAKRKEMMQNAQWRDKERERNVRRYEDEDRKQEIKDKASKYDKEFINKQFKHAASNETVEKRIKSNRNNIQRAGGAMNDHFARR